MLVFLILFGICTVLILLWGFSELATRLKYNTTHPLHVDGEIIRWQKLSKGHKDNYAMTVQYTMEDYSYVTMKDGFSHIPKGLSIGKLVNVRVNSSEHSNAIVVLGVPTPLLVVTLLLSITNIPCILLQLFRLLG